MDIYPGQMYPTKMNSELKSPTKAISNIAQCTYTENRCIIANRKTYIFKLHTGIYINLPNTSHRAHTPLEYIAWINNSQMIQITYTALYKHLELLCNDSLQLCIYMTSSHILPPNAWKSYHDYFPSKPIASYPSMSSLVYYYTNILLFTCLLCTNNWECIRQAHINNPPACCCYYWMLLFFLFICDCGSTTQAEQKQQQHDKVTTRLMWRKKFHN